MKKNLLLNTLIIISVLLSVIFTTTVFAEKPVTVTLDGQMIEFDVQPQIINGRTMVPLRAIFETLGAVVSWDDTTNTVTATKDDTIVIASIGNNIMTVNGINKEMDVAPFIINGRTLVPVRFVSEAFGCGVDWDETTYTVILTTADQKIVCYPGSSIPDYSALTGVKLETTNSDETGTVYIYKLTEDDNGKSHPDIYNEYLINNGWTKFSESENAEFGGPIYGYMKSTLGVVMGVSLTANEVWITPF